VSPQVSAWRRIPGVRLLVMAAALPAVTLALKAQGTTILVITHRTSVLQAVDLMLLLVEGQVKAYGPRDQVLAALQQGKAQAAAALANPPAAPGTAQTSAA